MSRAYTNRTRVAQTTRPPQRVNPTRGMSEELPTEAQRDVSPTRREPIRGGAYTMYPPDEKKRQANQKLADDETRQYEEHRSANRPHYSYVGTVGGGEPSIEASPTAAAERRLPAQGSNLTPAQRFQKAREEEKRRKEKEYDEMKQTARQKAIDNEKREKERHERLRAEQTRKQSAFLDNLEGKSSGKSAGRPTDSALSATASGGVKGDAEQPARALVQLESMFPEYDKKVLQTLLREAKNNVDDVIGFLS